jgi:hypothetical protein
MRRVIALLLLALAVVSAAQAQPRTYNQAELDALLAPVALYPDPLLSNILVAATYPDDLRDAAAWSRANPHLSGQDAVRAVEPMPWHPSVKALVASPDLLARMDESPQWTADLGSAFLLQEPHVMDTVQGLRRRAQASGSLQSNDHFSVQQDGSAIAVYPAQPQVVYVPYYNPYVVYGPWWWHSYRPMYWRPWHPRPAVYVSTSFFVGALDWHRRRVHRPIHHHHHHIAPRIVHHHNQIHRHHVGPAPRVTSTPAPHPQNQIQQQRFRPTVQAPRAQATTPAPHIHNHVHQAQHARPIVQGAQIHQREHRVEQRREHRAEPRREHRQEMRQAPRQQQRRG